MPATIDLNILRRVLEGAQSMAAYYEKAAAEKAAQNAAMTAAGLAPLHNEITVHWDAEHAAERRQEVATLQAVMAMLESQTVAEAA